MRTQIWNVLALCVLLLSCEAFADEQTDRLAAVAKDVKEVCSQPSTNGQHWSIDGVASAEAGVQIKLLKLGSIGGSLKFSKEEWEGVQAVLAQDRPGDNASYRLCVQTLTPQFLNKLGNPKKSQLEKIGELADQFDQTNRDRVRSLNFTSPLDANCTRLKGQLNLVIEPSSNFHSQFLSLNNEASVSELSDFDRRMRMNNQQTFQAIVILSANARRLNCAT